MSARWIKAFDAMQQIFTKLKTLVFRPIRQGSGAAMHPAGDED